MQNGRARVRVDEDVLDVWQSDSASCYQSAQIQLRPSHVAATLRVVLSVFSLAQKIAMQANDVGLGFLAPLLLLHHLMQAQDLFHTREEH